MRGVWKLTAAGVTAIWLGVAGAAWAQQPPPAPPGAPPAGPMGGPAGGPGGFRGDPGGFRRGPGCMVQDGRLTEMLSRAHWRLRITPQEDSAWTKMTQDVTTALQPLASECGQRPAPAATLPDRLARMVQIGQVRQQVLGGVQSAVSTMYAQLAPDQKAEADRMFRRHGRERRGMQRP